MNTPLVSIIIPVYNAEKYLRQCLDSILALEYQDYEVIMVDDGSKDSSYKICEEYAAKDNRFHFYHKENGGVSSARNFGIQNSSAPWITFVDSDDYVTAGYLNGIDNRDEDIVITGYSKFDNSGIVDRWQSENAHHTEITTFINSYITDSLLRGPVFKFYKRSLIGDLRFLSDMKIGEDAYFVFKYLAQCKSFAVLSKGEYMVRLADKPDEVKYAISVDYSAQSLSHLKDAYDDLVNVHGIDKIHFLSYIGYFKRISISDWQSEKSKWYGNKDIKTLYRYVWPALTLKQKLRLTIARRIRR